MTGIKRKVKALVLFSGGLDSVLAVRVLSEAGLDVAAVHFSAPFYSSDWARKSSLEIGVKLKVVPISTSYFSMVANPPRGYGSQMNPCRDCKIYMFKRAERLRKRLGFDFLASGEVLGERPLSQTMQGLMDIEKGAGLEGRIVRPLSGKLLPATIAEEKGFIRREDMLSIRGRSRKPQIKLAEKFHIKEYASPAGGCLLTDPEFSRRLKEHLKTKGSITWDEGELLKFGRHFRYKGNKIVVGRNEKDNEEILRIAKRMRITRMELVDVPGPLTVITEKASNEAAGVAAGLTVRYSGFKGNGPVEIEIRKGRSRKVVPAEPSKPGLAKKLMV